MNRWRISNDEVPLSSARLFGSSASLPEAPMYSSAESLSNAGFGRPLFAVVALLYSGNTYTWPSLGPPETVNGMLPVGAVGRFLSRTNGRRRPMLPRYETETTVLRAIWRSRMASNSWIRGACTLPPHTSTAGARQLLDPAVQLTPAMLGLTLAS